MQQPSILLVEDDADLRALVRRHLSGRGYQVAEADSVSRARGILDALLPDLLILDVNLPDGTGWDVARHVRGLPGGDIPIVVCSSHVPLAADLQGFRVQGYIPKPFNLSALAQCVSAALASAGPGYVPGAAVPEADDREAAFYSSLAHDMRTPMATLRTAVESLLADDVTWDEEAQREFLEAIASSAERVSKYACDVMDMARLDAGAMRAHLQRVDPSETVEVLARALRARRPVPPVTIGMAPETPAVSGDPTHIQRILLEMVENALRHTPPGSEVTVEVRARGGEVWWRVADRGPGVEPAERERIFDRHYRMAPTGAMASRGTRLSLYLCRELAGLQGGRVWAEDAVGGGACFCLALPAAREEPS